MPDDSDSDDNNEPRRRQKQRDDEDATPKYSASERVYFQLLRSQESRRLPAGLQDLYDILDQQREEKKRLQMEEKQQLQSSSSPSAARTKLPARQQLLEHLTGNQKRSSPSHSNKRMVGPPAWSYGPAPGYFKTPLIDNSPSEVSSIGREGSVKSSALLEGAWLPCPKPGKSRVEVTGLFGPAPMATRPLLEGVERTSMRPHPLIRAPKPDAPGPSPTGRGRVSHALHSAAQLTLNAHSANG
mmetsp:Transcript_10849/g.24874  ORF Transcript_10849/g.24874 Transcript_10849/m.24874 type:complete len:242 (-) Transcript_10849:44-769(-)